MYDHRSTVLNRNLGLTMLNHMSNQDISLLECFGVAVVFVQQYDVTTDYNRAVFMGLGFLFLVIC